MKKFSIKVTDIILLVISAAYIVLLLTVFKACGPKEDGSFMKCQWAWRAAVTLAVVITLNAVVHLAVPVEGIKTGLSIAILTVSVANILLVGTIIPLCGMETMACRSLTQPGNTVLGILTAFAALADIVFTTFKKKK
ncbi:MAG: DUF4418 family protein [Lachnospiraceae bacterium]|nr:DUF4418 family protein [Lachnospiraceae bacterium]